MAMTQEDVRVRVESGQTFNEFEIAELAKLVDTSKFVEEAGAGESVRTFTEEENAAGETLGLIYNYAYGGGYEFLVEEQPDLMESVRDLYSAFYNYNEAYEEYAEARDEEVARVSKQREAGIGGTYQQPDAYYELLKQKEISDSIATNVRKEIDDQVRARIAEETNRDKIRMAQQCVLMTLLEDLADRNTLLSYDPRIIHLTGDPAYLVNLLAEKPGERAMTKIKPEQFAELVPYVRIYKVRRNTANQEQAEFIFNSAVTPDELDFGNQFNRGKGVGLKSIDWTFDGSDPFTAGRSIQVNLELYFQSYGELVRERKDPNGIPYKFLDLILMSDCTEANKMRQDKVTDPSAAPEAFQTKTVREHFPECYEIKIAVGWSNPNTTSTSDLDLDASKTELWLTFQDHDMTINEDGTFSLKANYMARLVGLTSDPRANVFIDPANMELISKIKETQAAIDAATNDAQRERLRKALTAKFQEQRQEMVSSIIKELYYKNYVVQFESPSDVYVDFILKMRSGELIDKEFAQTLDGWRVFKDQGLNEDQLASIAAREQTENVLSQFSDEGKIASGIGRGLRVGAGAVGLDSSVSERDIADAITMGVDLSSDLPGFLGNFERSAKFLQYKWFGERPPAPIDDFIESATLQDFYADTVQFQYFYLGDLIDILSRRVLSPSSDGWRGPDYDLAVENIRILLGTFEYKLGQSESVFINLADIPISLALFADWLRDNVVDSSKETYPFMQFINDIMHGLVRAALGSSCFEGVLSQQVKIRKTFLNSSSRSGAEPFAASGRAALSYSKSYNELLAQLNQAQKDFEEAERLMGETPDPAEDPIGAMLAEHEPTAETTPAGAFVTEADEQLNEFYADGDGNVRTGRVIFPVDPENKGYLQPINSLSAGAHYHYLMFYMENLNSIANRDPADYLLDEANGIYHFRIGEDRGLVKRIHFNKANAEYLREARFAQQYREGHHPLIQLSNRYHVDIDMIGNGIYIPGRYLYIDPTSLDPALGMPSNPKSDSHILGLGGYHLVSKVTSYIQEGKYETKVSAMWESGGRDWSIPLAAEAGTSAPEAEDPDVAPPTSPAAVYGDEAYTGWDDVDGEGEEPVVEIPPAPGWNGDYVSYDAYSAGGGPTPEAPEVDITGLTDEFGNPIFPGYY